MVCSSHSVGKISAIFDTIGQVIGGTFAEDDVKLGGNAEEMLSCCLPSLVTKWVCYELNTVWDQGRLNLIGKKKNAANCWAYRTGRKPATKQVRKQTPSNPLQMQQQTWKNINNTLSTTNHKTFVFLSSFSYLEELWTSVLLQFVIHNSANIEITLQCLFTSLPSFP